MKMNEHWASVFNDQSQHFIQSVRRGTNHLLVYITRYSIMIDVLKFNIIKSQNVLIWKKKTFSEITVWIFMFTGYWTMIFANCKIRVGNFSSISGNQIVFQWQLEAIEFINFVPWLFVQREKQRSKFIFVLNLCLWRQKLVHSIRLLKS
jgi:hypothetical protein